MQVHVLFSVETQAELRPKSAVDGESNESIFLLRYENLQNPVCFWFGSLPPLPGSLQTFYYSVCSVFVSVSPFEFSITSLINIKTPLKSCKISVRS